MSGRPINGTRPDAIAVVGADGRSHVLVTPDRDSGAQPRQLVVPPGPQHQRHQQHQHQQHPHLQRQRQPQREQNWHQPLPPPLPPPPPPSQPSQPSSLLLAAPTPRRPSRLRASVETLVRKLSRHSLLSAESSREQPRQQQQLPPSPTSPNPPILLDFQPTPPPEFSVNVDNILPPPTSQLNSPLSGEFSPGLPTPADGQEGALLAPDHPNVSRQGAVATAQGHLARISDTEPGVDAMDDVLYAHPIPRPPWMESFVPPVDSNPLQVIEPDDNPDTSDARDAATLIENFRALRRAGTPGGTTVRRTVDGIPLRYRLSSQAASRCPNLVKSRPRMRKRKEHRKHDGTESRRDSTAQSETMTIDSTVSSEVMSTVSSWVSPVDEDAKL